MKASYKLLRQKTLDQSGQLLAIPAKILPAFDLSSHLEKNNGGRLTLASRRPTARPRPYLVPSPRSTAQVRSDFERPATYVGPSTHAWWLRLLAGALH